MHFRTLFAPIVTCTLLVLCACGGGSSGSVSPPTVTTPTIAPTSTPTSAPTPAASSTQVGPSGGTLVVVLGTSAVQITIPAGAFAAPQIVTLTAYATSPTAKPFSRRVASPQGSTFLLGFTIDAGSATLYKPLQASFTTSTPISSGSVVRLAMFGTKSQTYTDVDTAHVAGTTIVNDSNAAYVGISTANVNNPYALYAVPAGSAATPAPLVLTAVTTSAQPLPIQSTVTFTASGADANGNPYAFVPTYSLDSAAVGSLSAQNAPPYGAVLQTGNTSAQGNVIVTDASRNISGKTMVSVGSQRPANNGDAYSFSGTWSQTFDRTGQTPVTTTATLTQSVSVASGVTFGNTSGLYDFKSTQTNVAPLATTTTTAHAYEGYNAAANPIAISSYGSTFDDGLGNTSTTTYAGAQLIDQLPEQTGASWSNDGALTYVEKDAGGDAATLTYASNGTYTQTQTFVESSIYPNSTAQFSELSDGSGTLAINAYGYPYKVVYSAPSSGNVTVSIYLGTSTTPYSTQTLPSWFASPPRFYQESDKDYGPTALPQSCSIGSAIPTTANKLEQIISRLDTIAGYTETETLDVYDAAGYGPICSTINDVVTNYYNIEGDVNSPTGLAFSSTPYQTTTTTQTLALQTAQVIGSARAMTGARPAASTAAFATARIAFEARLRQQRHDRLARFVRALSRALPKGEVR